MNLNAKFDIEICKYLKANYGNFIPDVMDCYKDISEISLPINEPVVPMLDQFKNKYVKIYPGLTPYFTKLTEQRDILFNMDSIVTAFTQLYVHRDYGKELIRDFISYVLITASKLYDILILIDADDNVEPEDSVVTRMLHILVDDIKPDNCDENFIYNIEKLVCQKLQISSSNMDKLLKYLIDDNIVPEMNKRRDIIGDDIVAISDNITPASDIIIEDFGNIKIGQFPINPNLKEPIAETSTNIIGENIYHNFDESVANSDQAMRLYDFDKKVVETYRYISDFPNYDTVLCEHHRGALLSNYKDKIISAYIKEADTSVLILNLGDSFQLLYENVRYDEPQLCGINIDAHGDDVDINVDTRDRYYLSGEMDMYE